MFGKLKCKLGFHKEIKIFNNRKGQKYDLHCERCKKVLGKNISVFDVNSLYPSFMVKK